MSGWPQSRTRATVPLNEMEPGTFTFHLNVLVKSHNENAKDIRIPVDAVIQPEKQNFLICPC